MLYKYIGSKSVEDTVSYLRYFLDDGTISGSKPSTFNDPSELKMDLNIDAPIDVARKNYLEHGAEPNNFESWYKDLPQSKWSVLNDTRIELMENYGVICLTPKPDNYLMWSHYAESHTGFCIGFDDNFFESVEDAGLFDSVKYSDAVPVYNFFYEDIDSFVQKVFFNKHTCWKYEEEHRIITHGSGIKKFDKSHIKEVILGCRSSHELNNVAREYLGRGIEISKMITPFDTYLLNKKIITKDLYF